MDRIGVVGLSWRKGGPEALAGVTVPVEERAEWLPRVRDEIGVTELVYLATCNRVEIAFATDGRTPVRAIRRRLFTALFGREPESGEAELTLRAWAGEGAVEHLFLVACGLESARVGESEIVGQVKDSWKSAQELGLTGVRLDAVYSEALKLAAKVQTATTISKGRTSLAEIAIDAARQRLRDTPGRVALVGVSPMTIRCGRALAEKSSIVVANRSSERALALAGELGGRGLSLDEFRESPAGVEVVVLATAAPGPVLGQPELERLAAQAPSGRAPLIIDLAVPPDVTPEDAKSVGLPRMGMEEILAEAESHRDRRLFEAADARTLIDEGLIEFRQKMTERILSPMLGALQRRYRQTATEGIDRLMRKELAQLGEAEQEAVRKWAETLARRFAHVPTLGLRAVAARLGLGAVETFFNAADQQLADELKRVSDSERIREALRPDGQHNENYWEEPS